MIFARLQLYVKNKLIHSYPVHTEQEYVSEKRLNRQLVIENAIEVYKKTQVFTCKVKSQDYKIFAIFNSSMQE